jgi:hypothetical protein
MIKLFSYSLANVLYRFDREKAVQSVQFKKMLAEHGVKLIHTFSPNKSVLVEALNRKIQYKLQKFYTQQGGRERWVDVIKDVEHVLNNEYHSTIGTSPAQVTSANSSAIWQRMHDKLIHQYDNMKSPELKVGNVVRISQKRLVFQKASRTAQFSSELFKVSQVLKRPPIYMYKLKDFGGNPVDGSFRFHDLLRVVD